VSELDYKWILEAASRDPKFVSLLNDWQRGAFQKGQHLNVIGPVENHQAFIAAALALAQDADQGLVFIAQDSLQARRMAEALEAFWPDEVGLFPEREFQLSPIDASSMDANRKRLDLLNRLISGQKPFIIVTGQALLQLVPSADSLKSRTLSLSLGQLIEPQDAGMKLETMGYERVPLVDAPGQYALRGDILDIIPIDRPVPEEEAEEDRLDLYGIRISFFDDEIDQLRFFDPVSQRQVAPCPSISVPPAKEFYLSQVKRQELGHELEAWSKSQILNMKKQGLSPSHLETFESFIGQEVERILYSSDSGVLDRYIPLIFPEKTNFLDVLEKLNYRPILSEMPDISRKMDAYDRDHYLQSQQLIEKGQGTSFNLEIFFSGHEVLKRLDRNFSCLNFSLLGQPGSGFPKSKAYSLQSRATENYRGYEDKLFATLKERQNLNEKTYIYVSDQNRRDRMHTELLQRAPGSVERLIPLALGRGFEWPGAGLLVLGSQDVFGTERKKRRRHKKQEGLPIAFFSDMNVGDLVVHEVHGIGRYVGIKTLEIDGSKHDYIELQYKDNDVLYVPVESLDQLRRYVATGGSQAKLSSLGGGEWNKLKSRARESIKALAYDLVKLYAERSRVKGYAFPPDTVWDEEFAQSFPFEETDDQLQAIAEVKADMEKDKVMDRLLIGDVGFGKTEVAFRAMFKAVNGGKQAALMAPTTVLAQQHYENFLERVGNFPVRVGHLSRFASPALQKKTLRGLRTGDIDVVIGTHRILSDDVKFKDLGFLVIDEEQRFGVNDKEKIKALYPNIDVLALSATPIPRTLHMSLSGVRDISVIEEPPQDRREVQTFVMEYQEDVIGDAIQREIGRGGQVFYLFNNTRKINQEAEKLEKLLPGARILVAHGQMPERLLEDVIHSFVQGEADILLCTTIIESGIDMPNVNTLIVTMAERLGLSQLYQIKGRVGRSGRQAYAYITYEKDKVMNEDAQKRLAAIREYTELGAGFRIALRDLEVRGAGNLLGAEQHGHMAAIGYELYVQMLEEEVENLLAEEKLKENLQGEADNQDTKPVRIKTAKEDAEEENAAGASSLDESTYQAPKAVQTQIAISLDAYIPPDLVPDEGQRMDMYRRIMDIENLVDYYDVLDELSDRYGELPQATYTLADISYVKSRAGLMGIEQIDIRDKHIYMAFGQKARPNMLELSKLLALEEYHGQIHFNAGVNAHLLWLNQGQPLNRVPERLRRLFSQVEKFE
jgi:transcription-repair coupling factor (superfamily II helicase)